MSKAQAIAEVVSATVTGIVAQTLPKDGAALEPSGKPRFGSFLRVPSGKDGVSIIAVVHDVLTGPIDGVHRTSAFGLTREQLQSEQPQIFALLRTDIHASIIGYVKGSQSFCHLPPHPPEVHDFVHHATAHDITLITEDFDFLRLLSSLSTLPTDELLAAAIREAYVAGGKDHKFLERAGQSLCQLFRADYDRLVSILKKIRPN